MNSSPGGLLDAVSPDVEPRARAFTVRDVITTCPQWGKHTPITTAAHDLVEADSRVAGLRDEVNPQQLGLAVSHHPAK